MNPVVRPAMRNDGWAWAAIGMVIVVSVAGCTPPDSASVPTGSGGPVILDPAAPLRVEDHARDFVLVMASDRTVFRANEPIELETSLTYEGGLDEIEVWGPVGGLVGFSIRQLDGSFETIAVSTGACARHSIERGVPIEAPVRKSGSVDPADPDAEEMRAFLEDPQFRLPPGLWEISATSSFLVGSCELPAVDLRATLVLVTE